jgi:phage/plasmid-like protein (TIGR03299 family)
MFSARLTPWHRLGVVTPDVLTAADAIKVAGLDWTVEKNPVFKKKAVITEDGVGTEYVEVENRFVLERSTDGLDLAVVSDVYKPFQNEQAFSFMDYLVGSGEAKYETAGSLRQGRVIFISMETPKEIILPGDDKIQTYLLLRTTHDGSGKISVYVVTVRVVCMNTLTWAINGAKHSFGFTHTADVEGKIAQARESWAWPSSTRPPSRRRRSRSSTSRSPTTRSWRCSRARCPPAPRRTPRSRPP